MQGKFKNMIERDIEFRRRQDRRLQVGQILTPDEKSPLWATDIPGRNDTVAHVDVFEPCILLEDCRRPAITFLKVLCAKGVGYVDNDYMVEYDDNPT